MSFNTYIYIYTQNVVVNVLGYCAAVKPQRWAVPNAEGARFVALSCFDLAPTASAGRTPAHSPKMRSNSLFEEGVVGEQGKSTQV